MAKKYTQQELNKTLWSAADSSRIHVDAGVYKDYALTMLFFKYLSDLYQDTRKKYEERFGDDKARIEEKLKLSRFYIPSKATFDYIYQIREQDNIGEELNKVLHKIEIIT